MSGCDWRPTALGDHAPPEQSAIRCESEQPHMLMDQRELRRARHGPGLSSATLLEIRKAAGRLELIDRSLNLSRARR